MHVGVNLVRQGVIQSNDFVDVLEQQLKARPEIGALAIETRRLTERQVFQIMGEQVDADAPFGQLAIKLSMLNERDVAELLALQQQRTRPLEDVLVEMGLADQVATEQTRRAFRRDASAAGAVHSIKSNQCASSTTNSTNDGPVSNIVEKISLQTTKRCDWPNSHRARRVRSHPNVRSERPRQQKHPQEKSGRRKIANGLLT